MQSTNKKPVVNYKKVTYMQQSISSDKPVTQKEEDRFQRYNFSSRIAHRIISSKSNDSVVIGIYGAWGEGKTSVINFIEEELKTDDTIIPIRFNPWRFTDEASLLVSFFNTLATRVKASFPEDESSKTNFISKIISNAKRKWHKNKEPLKSNKETIGELIEKYGKIVSIFGAGEAAESIGKALSNVDIETLKKRFEELLVESMKKIVVFIDDIDRLDKQEIHSIFRLVKLTADFSNTFYILSFDQEMVASAIGERFGDGDKEAGFNFLEKIIQVPLKMPVAQPAALKQYCFELVDNAINENNIKLNEKDVRRFVSEFVENVLIRLRTPRLAVRYSNTLSFSFPLLNGEVNLVDLMLIEALKIFYPSHYEFVKKNSHYFLSSYSAHSYSDGHGNIETKKQELVNFLEELGKGLSKREKESVKSLLSELFPRLDEAFRNTYRQKGDEEWFKNKRIVSPEYFNRYFSYTVLKGEISDVLFDSFIASITNVTEGEIIEKFKGLIESSSIDNFLYKLRSRETDFDWEISKKLALSIALSGDMFKEDYNVFSFGFERPISQAAIFIYQLIKKHNNTLECFELAKSLMKRANPFSFAYEINNWLRTGETLEEKIFSIEQYQNLAKQLIDRALSESKDKPIFEQFPENNQYLLSVWKEINQNEFEAYIKKTLDATPKKVLDLLRAFTPVMASSSHPVPYKSSFSKDHYDFFTKLFDKEYIYEKVNNEFREEIEKEAVKFPDMDNNQTDLNILRQFNHWYEKEKKNIETSE